MNKQNQNQNHHILSIKNMANMSYRNNLSFKNLSHKSFSKIEKESKGCTAINHQKSHFESKHFSSVIIEGQNSQRRQPTKQLFSESYKMQKQALMCTLQMYKEQVKILNQENKRLKDQNSIALKCVKKSGEEIQKKSRQIKSLQQQNKDYKSILPKLIELESIQQNLINQNNNLKIKVQITEALLKNIANLTSVQQISQIRLAKITSLASSYLEGRQNKKSFVFN